MALLAIILELALGARTRSRPEGRRRGRPAPVRLANSSPLLSSAPVRSRIRWRRLLLGAVALLGVGVLTGSALIAARPVKVTERSDALANRDIILCLDVSTSMVTTDSRILDTFSELLDTFDGERVGLVAWNSTAQTMVPLTDDYELLRDQFDGLELLRPAPPHVHRDRDELETDPETAEVLGVFPGAAPLVLRVPGFPVVGDPDEGNGPSQELHDVDHLVVVTALLQGQAVQQRVVAVRVLPVGVIREGDVQGRALVRLFALPGPGEKITASKLAMNSMLS